MERPLLLRIMDGLVGDAPSGLEGVVGLSVRGKSGVTTWFAAFDKRGTQTGFVEFLPVDADALMVMGEREADHIVQKGALPAKAEQVAFTGDRKLFEQVLARYTKNRSWLDLRAAGWGAKS